MRIVLGLACLLLSGCSDKRPVAPTAEESARLDDADAMLNGMTNEEGPEARASDPSNVSTN